MDSEKLEELGYDTLSLHDALPIYCRTLAGFKKKKQRATQGMTKKEFHALVNTQWKRFIEEKNKDSRPKLSPATQRNE